MDSPITVRRSILPDVERIEALYDQNQLFFLEKRYGSFDLGWLIETSVVALTAINSQTNEVVGFVCFHDYPANASHHINYSEWEKWMVAVFGDAGLHSQNTLWLTLFIAEPLYEGEAFLALMTETFRLMPRIDACAFVLLRNVSPFIPLKSYMHVFQPKDAGVQRDIGVMACPRSAFVESLVVRQALVEDHDDLAPIFNSQSEVLAERYGEYFLADVIAGQDLHNRAVVAEAGGAAVGMMCVSRDVNVHVLHKCFQTDSYSCLAKPVEGDLVVYPDVEVRNLAADLSAAALTEADDEMRPDTPAHTDNGEATADNKSVVPDDIEKSDAGEPHIKPEPSVAGTVEAEGETTGEGLGAEGDGDGQSEVAPEGSVAASAAPVEEDTRSLAPTECSESDGPQATLSRVAGTGKHAASLAEGFLSEVAENNCFAITLYGLDAQYEERGFDFLRPAFELFPDLEYCLLTVPHTSLEFSLLQHFAHVPSKPWAPFKHSLYVFPKTCLLAPVSAYEAHASDRPGVTQLLKGMADADNILRAFCSSRTVDVNPLDQDDTGAENDAAKDELDPAVMQELEELQRTKTSRTAYVVRCEGSNAVAGVVIVNDAVDREGLSLHFQVEEHVALDLHKEESHTMIEWFVLNPLFAPVARAVLSDVFRVHNKTLFFHKHLPGHNVQQQLIDLFVQAAPRRQIRWPERESHVCTAAPPEEHAYALYCYPRRLLCDRKTRCNVRIVVVGASDTGLGFIEKLLLLPHLVFSSVTLVCPEGLSTDDYNEPCFETSCSYTALRLKQLALQNKLKVVLGKLVGLDRDNKEITLEDRSSLPYDILVLTPGRREVAMVRMEEKGIEIPKGAFSIATPSDIRKVRKYARRLKGTSCALVYGGTLQAYGATRVMLEEGIPPERIIFVSPPPTPGEKPCFTNTEITSKVDQAVKGLGVQRKYALTLQSFESNPDTGTINAATFKTLRGEEVTLPCKLFASADLKLAVSPMVFHALNDNSLVFDSRLVINHAFQTNDPFIYAAGPVAKFARRYRTKTHFEEFNSKEVGEQLALSILANVDPNANVFNNPFIASQDSTAIIEGPGGETVEIGTLPTFTRPGTLSVLLPGGLRYLYIYEPPHLTLGAASRTRPQDVRHLTTDAKDSFNYCEMTVGMYDTVEDIGYLGPEEVEISNFQSLVGLCTTYLGNLIDDYNRGKIEHLVSYLRQNWLLALYHDRFPEFKRILHEEMIAQHAFEEILEKIKTWAATQGMSPKQILQFRDQLGRLVTKETKRLAMNATMDFARGNQGHLPQYWTRDSDKLYEQYGELQIRKAENVSKFPMDQKTDVASVGIRTRS